MSTADLAMIIVIISHHHSDAPPLSTATISTSFTSCFQNLSGASQKLVKAAPLASVFADDACAATGWDGFRKLAGSSDGPYG